MERLLYIPEVAEMLRRTPAALRWQIAQGTAPKSAVIGGRRVFRESDVIAFVDAAFEESA